MPLTYSLSAVSVFSARSKSSTIGRRLRTISAVANWRKIRPLAIGAAAGILELGPGAAQSVIELRLFGRQPIAIGRDRSKLPFRRFGRRVLVRRNGRGFRVGV